MDLAKARISCVYPLKKDRQARVQGLVGALVASNILSSRKEVDLNQRTFHSTCVFLVVSKAK